MRVNKLCILLILFALLLGLHGCAGTTNSTQMSDKPGEENGYNEIIDSTTSDTSETIPVAPTETVIDISGNIVETIEGTEPYIEPLDIPEDFYEYTKFIGQDVATLGIDANQVDLNDYTHELWHGSLFGYEGTITYTLGWDDKTITNFTILFDSQYYLQGDAYNEMSQKLEDIFGDAVFVYDGIYNFSGKTECDFRLTRNGAGIGWNEENREKFERNKPQEETTPMTEPIKKEPSIGMTAEEVRNSTWGEPDEINKTTTAYGVREQWVYKSYDYDYKYIYLENGIVTAIQE